METGSSPLGVLTQHIDEFCFLKHAYPEVIERQIAP